MKTEMESLAEPVASKQTKRPIRRRRRASETERMANKHRAISRIADLSPDQLDQLADWHLREGLSIDACAQRATAEFKPSLPIPKTSVQRFLEHRRTADVVCANPAHPNPTTAEGGEDAEGGGFNSSACSASSAVNPSLLAAATEINQYAATGSAEFSPATLFLFEQKAFELTQHIQNVRPENPEQLQQHLRPLKDLWLLIHKAKSTDIRQRHAAVQEEKCQFRRDQLKARGIEVEVRERQRQQHLDLQHDRLQHDRDKFEFQKQQATSKRGKGDWTGLTGFTGLGEDSNLNPVNPVNPVKDPYAHIQGGNYYDETNSKIWILAADVPPLPFTDTAMKFDDRRNPLPPVDHSCSAAVQDYADRAALDYIQYLSAPPRPKPANSSDYDFYLKSVPVCPCGQPKPCQRHIFIALFSYAHPWSHAYRQCLLDRGLPYVPPTIPFPGEKPGI